MVPIADFFQKSAYDKLGRFLPYGVILNNKKISVNAQKNMILRNKCDNIGIVILLITYVQLDFILFISNGGIFPKGSLCDKLGTGWYHNEKINKR